MSQSSATNSDATKRILAKAEAAKSTQIQTVEELSRQGEQIKRTQAAMNDINRDLEKANAILRDMENPLSWIKGIGKKDEEQNERPPSLPSDKTFTIQRKKKMFYKENTIIFTRGKFVRLRPKGALGEVIFYIAVDSITICKADGHVNLTFKDGMMKPWHMKMKPEDVKEFVQEFIRRAFEFNLETKIEFEPGVVNKFSTDPDKLKKAAPSYLEMYSEGKSAHAELVGGANGEEKDEDEENLKAISGVLKDMKGLANLQNHMITQQNKELDDLAASVDHGHDKLKATNKRVEKQLK